MSIDDDKGTFFSLELKRNGVDPSQRPRLACSKASQLAVTGGLNVDQDNTNNGSLNPGIIFGPTSDDPIAPQSGEGISSRRTAGVNQNGLDFYTGSALRVSIDNTGNVGIGTNQPQAKLQVANGAIMPSTGDGENAGLMFPKEPGGGTGDAAWMRYYPRTGEACTLEIGISNDADDHIALMPSGNVGIGTKTPGFKLDITDRMRVRQGASGTAGIWFYQTTPATDRAFVGMANDNQIGLWGNTGANWGLLMDTTSGNLTIKGDFEFPNTGGGLARFTNQKYSNESAFKKNNVKLSLGSVGPFYLPSQPPLEYEFTLGHTWTTINASSGPWTFITNFAKKFSVNQNGEAYFAGAKTGFVVDYFVNRVGDSLEQGDVVVISQYPVSHYSGNQNDIPIPEVDLTDKAYDSRICGIVAKFVTEADLPYVEIEQEAQPEPEELVELNPENIQPFVHPLQPLAAQLQEGADPKQVQNQQMGTMVTLGAYAHCKVDADIAPIEVGDLLTTSTTKGHAQKVLEPGRAVGAIIGKALAPLEKGKGKIPVLVMLQ